MVMKLCLISSTTELDLKKKKRFNLLGKVLLNSPLTFQYVQWIQLGLFPNCLSCVLQSEVYPQESHIKQVLSVKNFYVCR